MVKEAVSLCGAGPLLDGLVQPMTILVGHFGSGKTEIAINLALAWRRQGTEVSLVDLDLVKPYFRCRLAKDDLEAQGIQLLAPAGDRFYADLPILIPEARAAAGSGACRQDRVIFDVGGDDLGARVLGSLSGLLDRTVTDVLFVVNANRPFAEDLAALRKKLEAVQAAARVPVTGLVANTHLMEDTTLETVRQGVRVARQLEGATGIPLRFCAMLKALVQAFEASEEVASGLPILALERHIVPPFAVAPGRAHRRSPGV